MRDPRRVLAAALIAATIAPTVAAQDLPQLRVTTDFASGAADVDLIDQAARMIRLKPPTHPDRGWPCWWYFKVTGIEPGEIVTLQLGGNDFAQPQRATFSLNGRNWQHTSPGELRDGRMVYQQRIDAREAWFAWGPPFTPDDAAQLVRAVAKDCADTQAFELCRSRGDRPVPAVRIGQADQPSHTAWILARQHAWECGSSWVCRGLIEWFTSDDQRAAALRKRTFMQIVPLVDVDNVAIGAGGKEEQPHDHNRDWTGDPYFPAVAALEREIKAADKAGRFDLFVDLHDPGPTETEPFFFLSPHSIIAPKGSKNLARFLAAAQVEVTGPLPYRGLTRDSGPDYDAHWQQIGKNWVTANTAGHVVSVTLEVPWNTPASTADGYRELGRQLGRTIERFFREPASQGLSE